MIKNTKNEKTMKTTGFHLVRSIKEFDASIDEGTVYFDILATSTIKNNIIQQMKNEVKAMEDFPALRECIVTQTSENSYMVITNDCPGHALSQVVTNFEIIEMPIELETSIYS